MTSRGRGSGRLAQPETQHAVQLVRPNVLRVAATLPVRTPGPHQILARVEAVGLCFSDVKLLHQFSLHPRKGEVLRGPHVDILPEIPSYVPGEMPTVPGHEVCCRIVAVGTGVRRHRVGERCLVQTDYRHLATASSNAAFGYNFEGGLQEYVLMDERVVIDPETGERLLIPVSELPSAAAVALLEPWACVEASYVSEERSQIREGGVLLVVADEEHEVAGLPERASNGAPASVMVLVAEDRQLRAVDALTSYRRLSSLDDVGNESVDDIIYYGASRQRIEALDRRLAPGGLINIVTGGQRISEPVSIDVGRVHYDRTRWVGTHGSHAVDSYEGVPRSGDLRAGDRFAAIGAAGPMGQMHIVRAIGSRLAGISVTATDIDDSRLEGLARKAGSLAADVGIPLRLVNTRHETAAGPYDYIVVLVPLGSVVSDAVMHAADGCRINVFAGIPSHTRAEIDLDAYIDRHCYFLGTSGSVIADMKAVLGRLERGLLDTNLAVDAISGMAGVPEAIAAVEQRGVGGKIIVYPALPEVPFVRLSELSSQYPSVSAQLDDGRWTKAAEQELLRATSSSPRSPMESLP